MHIRKPKVAPGIPECQAFMIEPELVQDSRLQIVNMNPLLNRVESQFVRDAVRHPAFDAMVHRTEPAPETFPNLFSQAPSSRPNSMQCEANSMCQTYRSFANQMLPR